MSEKQSASVCKQNEGRVFGRIPGASGFSLIELLIALAIFGLLLGLGLPSYGNWIASRQLANQAEFLAETLNQARSEAIMRGDRVNLCKSRDRRQCADDGGWEIGWIMFVDQNHNGEIDDDEVVVHTEGPVGTGITISANRPVEDYVSYTSLGHARLLNGALQMGTFAVCKSGQNAIKVILANGGRARIAKTTQRCP